MTYVVLLDPSSTPAFHVLNPNEWSNTGSKGIIHSCATELGLLTFEARKLKYLFDNAEMLYRLCFEQLLKESWGSLQKIPPDYVFLAEVPEAHVYIEAFLGSAKTFLDLIVQLVTTEGIVSSSVDGFHKKGQEIGGSLLACLSNNVRKSEKTRADQLRTLVREHKGKWIDEVVTARDSLVHPEKGAFQVGFQLRIEIVAGTPNICEIVPPSLGGQRFDCYAEQVSSQVAAFAESFLKLLK